jgi:hypothetical protein
MIRPASYRARWSAEEVADLVLAARRLRAAPAPAAAPAAPTSN